MVGLTRDLRHERMLGVRPMVFGSSVGKRPSVSAAVLIEAAAYHPPSAATPSNKAESCIGPKRIGEHNTIMLIALESAPPRSLYGVRGIRE